MRWGQVLCARSYALTLLLTLVVYSTQPAYDTNRDIVMNSVENEQGGYYADFLKNSKEGTVWCP